MQNSPSTRELQRFIRYFNKFFDVLNVANQFEGERKRNPDLLPFRTVTDERLQVRK